jgi:DDE superfamily endonuclease
MLGLPSAAEPLVGRVREAFTRPSFERFVLLCVGAIVTFGRRSVSRILWTIDPAMHGHASSYHRLFSNARWSLWPLAKVLAAMVLELVPADQPVLCAADDHVIGRHGKCVYGRARHCSAVGSTKGLMVWGHRWVVLAILVKFPFSSRYWALPVLCALYRDRKTNQREKRRHKTPCLLARQMLATLLHWFPDRRFIAIGDGGFAAHDLARFAHRHRRRLTLIARGRGDLNLYALPKPHKPCRQTVWKRRKYNLRPRCRRGRKLRSPAKTVEAARACKRASGSLPTQTLRWYGQSRKTLEIFSDCGGWYHAYGKGVAHLVPLRWVYTCDPKKPRDQRKAQDWFFCTDANLTPKQIIEIFACRWSIEVTFQELHAHLAIHTLRHRSARSVLRTVPWLLGLFSAVCVIASRLWQQGKKALHHTPCYHKPEATFADALYAVRRSLWDSCLLKTVLDQAPQTKLTASAKRKLITYLAEAA